LHPDPWRNHLFALCFRAELIFARHFLAAKTAPPCLTGA